MDICDYLTGVLLGAQEPPDQFVETSRSGAAISTIPFTGAPSVTSASAAATSSDTMG